MKSPASKGQATPCLTYKTRLLVTMLVSRLVFRVSKLDTWPLSLPFDFTQGKPSLTRREGEWNLGERTPAGTSLHKRVPYTHHHGSTSFRTSLPFGPALRPETQCRRKTSGSKTGRVLRLPSTPLRTSRFLRYLRTGRTSRSP